MKRRSFLGALGGLAAAPAVAALPAVTLPAARPAAAAFSRIIVDGRVLAEGETVASAIGGVNRAAICAQLRPGLERLFADAYGSVVP